MQYIVFAFLSAIFAGITSILAKMGVKNVPSNLLTALRCVVVLVFSWAVAFLSTDVSAVANISQVTLIFLVLSGLATGASWLCYFHALKYGNVNVVVPIDKSSVVITMLIGMVFLSEGVTKLKIVCMVLISLGTYLMTEKKEPTEAKGKSYILSAFLGAFFASLTSILGKIGISGVNSNLGTAIRCVVVVIMAWIIVFMRGEEKEIKNIDKKSLLFIVLSGFATGASWLCYFYALSGAPASVVAPIDKLSIFITVVFSSLFLKERLSKKGAAGLILILAGTMLLLI